MVPRERPRRAGQWDLGWDIPGTGRLQRRDEDGSGELGVGAQISLGLEGRKEFPGGQGTAACTTSYYTSNYIFFN